MDDFAKKFDDVHCRAYDQPDFNPDKARWRIDLSTWHLVIKHRFYAFAVVLGMPGDNKLMGIPVTLVATSDMEYLDISTAPTSPSSIVQPDPTLICISYQGRYGFVRYVVSAVADVKFREFDTTEYFTRTIATDAALSENAEINTAGSATNSKGCAE